MGPYTKKIRVLITFIESWTCSLRSFGQLSKQFSTDSPFIFTYEYIKNLHALNFVIQK